MGSEYTPDIKPGGFTNPLDGVALEYFSRNDKQSLARSKYSAALVALYGDHSLEAYANTAPVVAVSCVVRGRKYL